MIVPACLIPVQLQTRRPDIVSVSVTSTESVKALRGIEMTYAEQLAKEQRVVDELCFEKFSDPDTSAEAGRDVNVDSRERDVLNCLREHGPRAICEIADITCLSLVTVSPRIAPL